ncbi:MAG: hypothetical protein CMF39_06335 [Legionellaceae bacterium]|nr:hypothetical protein [Legionellaceae bacterium]|tara:strand:- start:94 stop:474 length:381 start_codon:yes stop_codon:yes gene_type:complete
MSEKNLSVVLEYYDAISKKQLERAAEKLADNVQIISPLATKNGKRDVLAALKGFSSVVENIKITDQFASGDKVMLAYEMLFPKPIGILRAAGLINLENGLIKRIELFYDGQVVMSKKDDIFSSGNK